MTCALCFCGSGVLASSHRDSMAEYARAQKIHQHLNAKPLAARTRGEYERALDGYRSVYHRDPGSPDAARSIAAVAELLASEGRCFHEAGLFHAAVAQWEFLRREYPGSSLGQRALFEEAEIARLDLHDRGTAIKIQHRFLTQYPRGPLAAEVRVRLKKVTNGGRGSATPLSRVLQSREKPVPIARTVAPPRIAPPAAVASAPVVTLQAARCWAKGSSTRVAVDMTGAVPYHAYLRADGRQITLIFFGAQISGSLRGRLVSVGEDANVHSIRASVLTGDQAELVLELNQAGSFSTFTLSNPNRVILDIRAVRAGTGLAAVAATAPEHMSANPAAQEVPIRYRSPVASIEGKGSEAASAVVRTQPAMLPGETLNRQRSMTRVLGLHIRRIVIDAGHGGYDSGTLGPGGLEEKDVALDVALRLGHLLQRRLGAHVIYTRRTDKFVPLEERTAIANRAHADLFLSIHANSSADPEVRGVETYFLNFTASPDALRVAARENAISNRSGHELSGLVRKIALSDKIDESRVFAADVQQSLYEGLAPGNPGLKNRGVKQAPFMVLIGANMPSILAEISFLTNPEDASELMQPEYRERLAESLYRGVAGYVDGMSGVRMAKTVQAEVGPQPAE